MPINAAAHASQAPPTTTASATRIRAPKWQQRPTPSRPPPASPEAPGLPAAADPSPPAPRAAPARVRATEGAGGMVVADLAVRMACGGAGMRAPPIP